MGDRVGRGYVALMMLLGAVWGASFLFIKVANRDLDPSVVMELRLVLAALTLLPILLAVRGRAALEDLRSVAAPAGVLGVINAALPFTLIAWGETRVDSGVAAIGNASTPLFVVLLAIPFLPSERSSGLRLAGIALGLLGVGVLAGVDPQGGLGAVAGTMAVVLASFLYAASNIYLQPRFPEGREIALVTGSMLVGAAILLPLALVQAPAERPGWKAAGSVIALATVGTSFGLVLYYRMLRLYGSARASLVTYVLPVTALAYGIGLLGEPLTLAEVLGLALILGGVALGSGLVQSGREQVPVPALRETRVPPT